MIPPGVEVDNCQRTAIVGLGGVGKTQVALEAAFQVRDSHPDCSIFWVPAVDSSSFENAYRKIGDLLRIDGINEKDADAKILVKTALSQCADSWLLIIDNADNTELLFDHNTGLINYLPSSWNGSILFTTRNREIISRLDIPETNVLAIEEMSENEALELLTLHLNQSQMQDMECTRKLAESLGYLPLALRQASAYMAKTRISTSKYLDLCQSSDRNMIELLSRDFEDRHRYKEAENSIATTWLISFRDIEDHYPLAADYLKFMSFLGQKDIPQTLLPPADVINMEEALGVLKAYAFISEREECSTYDMHRLVQLATLNWLTKKGDLSEWSTRALQRLAEVFPFPEQANRDICMRYLPHARCVLEFEKVVDDQVAVSNLLAVVGLSLRHLGQYRDAEAIHRRELEIRERMQGPEHPNTLDSVNDLAIVLSRLGKHDEAEAMHRQAVEIKEKVLGPEHPSTLNSMNSLAVSLSHLGKHGKTEKMHRRVLETKKILGPVNVYTLTSFHNLAVELFRQGKYEAAEAMHRRALNIREKVLGSEHPVTLESVNSLASTLYKTGKHDEAVALHRRALEIREKVLGPEHPDTLNSVNNLGFALSRPGKYEEAETMHRRALEIRERVLGPEHPNTINSANNLAIVLCHLGRYDEAEAMHQRVLEMREKVLGPEHPHTLNSVGDLGFVLKLQGSYEEAEAMYRRVLEGRQKMLGPAHPHTIESLNKLASVVEHQGNLKRQIFVGS